MTFSHADFEAKNGYYGDGKFGGRYVPEILLPVLEELEQAFEKYRNDKEFLEELEYYRENLIGRPSPLIYAENLTKKLRGAKIYLKNEGNNFTGSHKINHCVYHALLAKRMGKTTVIAETGAGQHGLAVATVCAKFGMKAKIFMGQKSIEKQYPNVFWIKQLGAEIIPVTVGNAGLTEASNAALGEWMGSPETYFMLGSVIGPNPFPELNREAQKIIGQEVKKQLIKQENNPNILPDKIVACIGGGSNAIGIFNEFLADESVKLIGVEAGGEGVETAGKHATRFGTPNARIGVFEGFKSYFLMNNEGQIDETRSISAGLDYAGIGPLHAHLHDIGRLKMAYATDKEVVEAFQILAQTEGILAALESCHAIAETIKQAKKMQPDQIIVANVSGRADNYIFNVAKGLGDQAFKDFCREFEE
jgi:tryptophan synthase beta chain